MNKLDNKPSERFVGSEGKFKRNKSVIVSVFHPNGCSLLVERLESCFT